MEILETLNKTLDEFYKSEIKLSEEKARALILGAIYKNHPDLKNRLLIEFQLKCHIVRLLKIHYKRISQSEKGSSHYFAYVILFSIIALVILVGFLRYKM